MIRIIPLLLITMISATIFADKPDGIHYISLNRAIRLGQYDGVTTAKELKSYGDFGLGSEEKVASELVILDGVAYSIPADGKAKVMPDQAKIAFSAIKFFKTDKQVKINKAFSLKELEQYLDSLIVKNTFAAIKISGEFASITFTSYHKQEKPYKPIEQVPVSEFTHTKMKGTIVGFFTPESAAVLNSPTYHFHFIDQARTTGGHVQDCVIGNVEIELDYTRSFTADLADPAILQHIDLNKPIEAEK
ncbi:acetolactate decarboxylase [Cytophagaceae bacterium DM2B3-1]|uniref:Alpha-acetolactate decarboxylase n=1 Tax=Xanthocytophaga flava TaxID=3048013 RepID=A0ABT7CNX3_9BACT|nr:acetolactate decarboxylase [Xanthocytophaga flavus]MDJ1495387.1 acetolactate decarboxylase [Xanthocytophaga flavus]